MYYIAPLLLWACAEMTCGFFIFCVPCITTVIKESGLPENIRNLFGVTASSSNIQSNPDSSIYRDSKVSSTHKKFKVGKGHNDSYYNVDEEDGGLPLGPLKSSESQEYLHMQQRNHTLKVVRTTHTTVVSDVHSAQSDTDLGAMATPWSR